MASFDDKFNQFRDISEPSGTLFTIVVYGLKISDVVDAIDHRMQIAKELRQSKKKTMVFARLNLIKDHLLEQLTKDQSSTVDAIYLVGDIINCIKLEKQWIKTLNDYCVDRFIFKYGEKFETDYLKQLLTDLSYYNVIYIKNNEYTHTHLNPTKKKIVFTKESRTFDLNQYINDHISNGEPCLIHGISSVLKYFKHDRVSTDLIFTRKLEDIEIIQLFQRAEIMKLHVELEKDLSMMTQEKFMHRLVFGKDDIQTHIKEKQLKVLYCSPEIFEKLVKNIPREYRTAGFCIHCIHPVTKGDIGDRLKNDFSGMVGVTYY